MLRQLRERLQHFTPHQFESRRPQASVLIALTDECDPKVILTKRSARLSTHGGEVAFPGGKHDSTDPDLLFTALREANEEVGLIPDAVEVLGRLGQVMSKHQLQVTPWVGIVPADVALHPNLEELDSLFKVPISFLLQDHRVRTDYLQFKNMERYVPAYEYEGHLIWGLTAYILVELLNVGFDANIPIKPRPEHDDVC